MNCQEWEERISGDLEAPEVARHLADCAGCQVFASGLRQALETLQAAHADPLPEGAYAAVRARVMAKLQPRRRWGWVWATAGLAAVTLAVLVTGGAERRMRVAELPAVAWKAPGAPELRLPVSRKALARREKAPVLQTGGAAGPREEVLVKMETGDPEVVIYWIAETRGELPR